MGRGIWVCKEGGMNMDEYDRGFYDALKWVYEHTGGDNYKLSVKNKMQEFIKEE